MLIDFDLKNKRGILAHHPCGIMVDRVAWPGGTEYRVLISPVARELIRAAVVVAGVGLLFLIYFLI